MGKSNFRDQFRRARLRAVVVTSSVLLIAGSLAGLATSASAAPAASAGDGTSDAVAPLSADAQPKVSRMSADAAAIEYWTPARMAAAIAPPAPTLAANPSGSKASTDRAAAAPGFTAPSDPVVATGQKAAASLNKALSAAASVNASATVGVVFFTDPANGLGYRCSGSALNSNSKRLVITAGHCVYGGGHYMTNVVFVPRYNNGSRPYGTFAARTIRTFDAWRSSSSRDHDIAMFTTSNNSSGQVLVNTVGGNGLSWNYSHSIFLTILAYPADPPYDGTWQQYCQGTIRQVGIFDGRIELHCGFTGGSSGGPWFRAYDSATGIGYVNGVMSTLASNGYNRSSYFDTKVKTMFDATAGD
jgi:V8-like Glu-specific endopeptidase